MIGFAVLLAAAAPQTAVDAERAFAAMAQTEGQWTAFRAYAAPEGIMFFPKPGNALARLKNAKDPPQAVMWWPGRSWESCDGSLAVNTGPWLRSGGTSTGTFTTVWQRQADGGWKWLLDHGRETPRAVPARDEVVPARPECRNLEAAKRLAPADEPAPALIVQLDNKMPEAMLPRLPLQEGERLGGGMSADGSLHWEATALSGGGDGAHMLRVWTWDGARHRLALFEASGIPAQ